MKRFSKKQTKRLDNEDVLEKKLCSKIERLVPNQKTIDISPSISKICGREGAIVCRRLPRQ